MEAVANEAVSSLQVKQLEDAQEGLTTCMKASSWSNDDMLRLMTTEVRVVSTMTTRLLNFIQRHELSGELQKEEGFTTAPLVVPQPAPPKNDQAQSDSGKNRVIKPPVHGVAQPNPTRAGEVRAQTRTLASQSPAKDIPEKTAASIPSPDSCFDDAGTSDAAYKRVMRAHC